MAPSALALFLSFISLCAAMPISELELTQLEQLANDAQVESFLDVMIDDEFTPEDQEQVLEDLIDLNLLEEPVSGKLY